jgi:quercetin dioxygenase-like cupin family protein
VRPVQSWDLNSLEVEARQPRVLESEDEGRAIVINLPSGEQLQEHQVHERAWVIVTGGEVEITDSQGEGVVGGPGLLCVFDPNERHEVTARANSRLLLVLSPWPGEGHPSAE